MHCSSISIYKERLLLGIFSSFLITSGFIIINNDIDANKSFNGLNKIGVVIFSAGWIGISITSLLHPQQKLTLQRIWNEKLKIISPIIAIISSLYSQYIVAKGQASKYIYAMFLLFGGLLFWFYSMNKDFKDTDGKWYMTDNLRFMLSGTCMMAISLLVINNNRRYNLFKNDFSGPSNVYNHGIYFFTTGWILFTIGISSCKMND